MPVASLRDVMDALAAQITTAMSGAAVDIQVGGRMIIAPSPPTIDMYLGDPSADTETAAFADIHGGELLIVRARVATGDNSANQDLLIDFMDRFHDLSVGQAIMDDPTVAGLANVDVQTVSGLRQYADPQGEGIFLGAEWGVIVLRIES